MIGAIIGDIVGSRFEWHNHKSKDFELFTPKCRPTDDSIMTLAVAQAILDSEGDLDALERQAVARMQELGRAYPDAGYGGRFGCWIEDDDPRPYNSWGNGSAMRVSACAYAAGTLPRCLAMARRVTAVTHDHPLGLRGAEAVTEAIFLARTGRSMPEIHAALTAYYPLDCKLEVIRPHYRFDVSAEGSVPWAIEAFLESADFEDAVRNAVSIGGDSDTIAAITASIAEAYYGVPEDLRRTARSYLDERLLGILDSFEARYGTGGPDR